MNQHSPGRLAALLLLWLAAVPSGAGPYAEPGDLRLRHDIQLLNDAGLIDLPVSMWPLSWGDIAAQLANARWADDGPRYLRAAADRLRVRLNRETTIGLRSGHVQLEAAASPRQLRSFEDTPRENVTAMSSIDWTGDRFAFDISTRLIDNPDDGQNVRFDNSWVGVSLGNAMLSVGYQERWWGPGWDNSLILSTNARPLPGVSLQRNVSAPFQSRWLSWIGPWTASFVFARMEGGRAIPHPYFIAARGVFRPLDNLEIGVTRTAQWGGDGRPEDFDSFIDLVLGRTNIGSGGITRGNEPGNQLGGFDARYVLPGKARIALYSQWIGEDEAGGFPSRYMGQFGAEHWGSWGSNGASYRGYLEFSDSTCNFYQSDPRFNCAYNNGTYTTGYRYRGRSIGHSADNDARGITAGLVFVDSRGYRWSGDVRVVDVNRGGRADARNTISPLPEDYWSVNASHARPLPRGSLEVGVGVASLTSTDMQVFVRWQSD